MSKAIHFIINIRSHMQPVNNKLLKLTSLRDKIEDKCLLEQGIICLGPATRGSCEARCLDANMPCTGCGGPTPNALDQGAKMISALASVLGIEGEENMKDEEVQKLIDQIVDPIGTFYKYGLPNALINRRMMK